VLFHFFSAAGALKVLLKDVGFVEGVEQGCVEIAGSPEYAMYLNDYMSILQDADLIPRADGFFSIIPSAGINNLALKLPRASGFLGMLFS
jgi:hypothetical protein